MLQVNIGIGDTTGTIDPAVLVAAAAAINVQVTRDLPQFWPISATVSVLTDVNSIPQGVWPVVVVDSLQDAGGYHQTEQNQPYALIAATPGSNGWTLDASHEIIEMLIDPFGSRLQVATAMRINDAGDDVIDDVGSFEYLVEACDPCEAANYAYPIDGIVVSDFLTPNFYDRVVAPGGRYSFTGAITRPRQVLPGGYISWQDVATGGYKQILWLGDRPEYKTLPPAPADLSLREHVDTAMIRHMAAASAKKARLARLAAALANGKELSTHRDNAGRKRAKHYKLPKHVDGDAAEKTAA